MPSLPELEIYQRDFQPLLGTAITDIEVKDWRLVRADPKELDKTITGHPLKSIKRYGKYLIFDTGKATQMVLHLGLTGKLSLHSSEDKLPRNTRVIFHLTETQQLNLADFKMLARLYLVDFESFKQEKNLGPDIMSLAKSDFIEQMHTQGNARDALMNQHIFAGIGGKYADEILFQARLHPNTKLRELSPEQLGTLYDLIQSIHKTAIELEADVERFPADWLIPHRRGDGLCPRGHGELAHRDMGGSATFMCLTCQPPPKPL